MDDVKEWSVSTSYGDTKRKAENREGWRDMVANLRTKDGTWFLLLLLGTSSLCWVVFLVLCKCSQGLGPNATQRLAGIPWLSLSRSHYTGTETDPTSRGPDCARLRLEPATSGPRSEASTN
ncbi:hypothetical protein ElyMa_007029300 [Elysia marginata]|uniref:Uncharacterized protein n=1 Tax=Elysia marginata TaxID=1093978 RepID=A0AAV4JU74_9GAST|nr:hypothetical protein ElyMa_007029300 [Elysia marginata]